MTTDKKERVGIVGVGRMGFAMLGHLLKHGYGVTACDLKPEALEKSRAAGAATAASPASLARQSDFVIIGVGYTDEVNAVVHGEHGLLANLEHPVLAGPLRPPASGASRVRVRAASSTAHEGRTVAIGAWPPSPRRRHHTREHAGHRASASVAPESEAEARRSLSRR